MRVDRKTARVLAVLCVVAAFGSLFFWCSKNPVTGNFQGQSSSAEGSVAVPITRVGLMHSLPGGSCTIGSTTGNIADEEPVGTITVSAFLIDSTPVTQADYLALRGVNPSLHTGNLQYPVENVSWYDAIQYCNARSKRDNLDTVYTGDLNNQSVVIDLTKNGYRLPTEGQYEYACRAGTITDDYWDGQTAGNYAWYSANSANVTHPVAQKLPNNWGLYDMAGNVEEWCNDDYTQNDNKGYGVNGADTTSLNPVSKPSGQSTSLRGGNCGEDVTYLMSAYRDVGVDRKTTSGVYGFRCVAPLAAVKPPTGLTYSTNPATYYQNVGITQNTATLTGGTASSFTISSALPSGLAFNTTTGAITGTPTVSQAATVYTVTANNSAGSATCALTLSIIPPPTALSYSTNPATYWQNIGITQNTATVSGGAASSFTISSALPAGLAFNTATGAITGTPTVSQTAKAYTVTAINGAGSATCVLNISVMAPPLGLSYSTNPATYNQNVAITQNTATVTGGAAQSFMISSALPAGLVFNTATGAITGTPTVSQAAKVYTVTAINAAGSATCALNLSVIAINPCTWNATGSGMGSYVSAEVADNAGNVYAGGCFTTANGVAANHIAKWNGSAWAPLGSGTNKFVYAMALDNSGNLYAAGNFDSAGGVKVNGIAKWDGSSWSALGTGFGTPCYAVVCDRTGNVYVGGSCGTLSMQFIGKWNGASWSGLGSGMSGQVNALACDSANNIYAGGLFAKAGGVSVNNIAVWNGSSWSALGAGTNGKVQVIYVNSSGSVPIVYAGGIFTLASGTTVNGIAQWNGTTWSALGSGVGGNGTEVGCLAPDKAGNLYAAGYFSIAGGVSANSIAKWNGTSWTGLCGGGLTSEADGMTFDASGKLWVGGMFGMAGTKAVYYIATCQPQ